MHGETSVARSLNRKRMPEFAIVDSKNISFCFVFIMQGGGSAISAFSITNFDFKYYFD